MKFLTRHKIGKRGVLVRKPGKERAQGVFREAVERSHFVKGLIAVGSCIGVVAIILIGRESHREVLDLYVGQPAPRDVFADIGFSYKDNEETAKLRLEASQKVAPQYSFSPEKLKECARQLRELLGVIDEGGVEEEVEGTAITKGGKGGNGRPALLKLGEMEPLKEAPEPGQFMSRLEAFLVSLSGPDAQVVRDAARSDVTADGSQDAERQRKALLKTAREAIDKWTAGVFPSDRRLKDAARNVLVLVCERSVEYDEALTQRVRDRFAARIKPVISLVQPGRKIIERGYEITPQQMDMYSAYLDRCEQIEPVAAKLRENLYYTLGLTLLMVMLLIVARRYLMYYHEQVYRSNSALFMLGLIVLGAVLLSRGIALFPFGTIKSSWNNIFYYLVVVSVPAAAILMTLLINRSLALFFTIFIGMLVGIMKGFSLPYMIVGVVGGVIAVYASIGVRRRSQLVSGAATIALANVITIGALGAIGDLNIVSATMGFRALGGFLTGVLASFVAASFLPIFEHAFNVVTDIRLLELSDLNHPLLKTMFIEAPGTYHHSIMVGNLAEAAAEAVGANPLQVRVCAYFHDIGKMNKPEYFTENELYGKNMHGELDPRMSSSIIRAHVKDGVDMALKHKLNRKIVDAIRQHHGDSLVYFFYRRAEEGKAAGEEVAKEDFRYEGPKPQSKETAILLLADAVEAASRSLSMPTPARIKSLVHEIINQRIIDGQLEECDLTFNELRLIAERFELTLNSTFHARIKYPEREGGAGETGLRNESSGAEPVEAGKD
jgi:putative nucleotidyltransferase with HDIG domain